MGEGGIDLDEGVTCFSKECLANMRHAIYNPGHSTPVLGLSYIESFQAGLTPHASRLGGNRLRKRVRK